MYVCMYVRMYVCMCMCVTKLRVKDGVCESDVSARQCRHFFASAAMSSALRAAALWTWKEKVPEKVPGSLGAKPSQVQQGSGESSGEGLGNLWCTARPGQVQWVQQGFQRLALQRFRQICENRILRLLGIPPKLILKEMEVLDPDT